MWSSKPTAPVWSALFNHSLFERNVMRIVAGFAVSEFSEGACLLICAVIRLLSAVVFIILHSLILCVWCFTVFVAQPASG